MKINIFKYVLTISLEKSPYTYLEDITLKQIKYLKKALIQLGQSPEGKKIPFIRYIRSIYKLKYNKELSLFNAKCIIEHFYTFEQFYGGK